MDKKKILNYCIKHYWLFRLIKSIWFIRDTFKCYLVSDRKSIRKKFKKRLGIYPNLENPKTFQEKLQWLKINNRDPFYTKCADKLEVRKVITEILGTDKYLIPLLFVSDNYRDIKLENLPDEPFVIKCNHDNGSYKIIRDKNKEDIKFLRNYYRMRLSAPKYLYWYNREWPYKNVKPKIMIERMLCATFNNDIVLEEYKFYCFEDKIGTIQLSYLHYNGTKSFVYLDENFKILKGHYVDNPSNIIESFDLTIKSKEMKEIALKISKQFKYHIRVDIYLIDDKLYVGELTFFDGAGYDEIVPLEWSEELGSLINIPSRTPFK